jgi:thiol:disulfide interchange protein
MMQMSGRSAEGRTGCAAGRLLGALMRLVLVYPLLSMGSHLGQAVQEALQPQGDTPYEGAAAGAVVALVIGLSLLRVAMRGTGWRGPLADATFVLVTALWLMGLAATMTGTIAMEERLIPWGACLFVAAVVGLIGHE